MEFTPDYYETASLVGDPSTSGNSCAITNEYIGELLTNHGVEDVRVKTSGSSYDSWMRNNLEDGVLFFNYRGYLGVSGFGNSDVDNANNGIMLPFATILNKRSVLLDPSSNNTTKLQMNNAVHSMYNT